MKCLPRSRNVRRTILTVLTLGLLIYMAYDPGRYVTITDIHQYQLQSWHDQSVTAGKDDRNMQEEVHHIAFLKVHKAGSSTMLNILYRFGLKRNLTFLVPKNYGNVYYHNKNDRAKLKNGGKYDIMAVHSQYSEDLWSVLHQDSFHMAIVRHPLQRMISAAFYYRDVFHNKYLRRVPRRNFICNLINHHDIYEPGYFSRTRNAMAWDFGFPEGLDKNHKATVTAKLEELDNKFKLVMVMERFHESLVLMKRMLNWTTQDMIYSKVNSHTTPPVHLYAEEIQRFNDINYVDERIYSFFASRFQKLISQQAADFDREVEHFGSIISTISVFCASEPSDEDNVVVAASEWNSEFFVRWIDCHMIQFSDIELIDKIHKLQVT